LLVGVLAYNLLHMLRQFCLMGEEAKGSMEWLIKSLIKVGAKVAYHCRWLQVHAASAFSLAEYYQAVLGSREWWKKWLTEWRRVKYAQTQEKRDLFVNVTTVFHVPGRVGLPRETF